MVKKILITGGLGYVGGRIAQHLALSTDYQVFVTSRRGGDSPIPNVTLLHFDDSADDFRIYTDGMDCVIHLAALNEIDCVRFPYEAIDVNIKQSLHWLNAAIESKVAQFIYFSTIHVYGSPLEGVISETHLTKPTHPYSITHRAAEDYVLAAKQNSAIDAIVLRLSNSYGAPVLPDVNRWTLLINDLCRQAVEKGQLTLHSDGSQERDFIAMHDVVRTVAHFLKLEKTQTQDGLFNLSSESTFKVFEMAQKISERFQHLFGKQIPINREAPANIGQAPTVLINAAKLRSTGFAFQGSPDQEIDEMLLFCQKHFGIQAHD